MSSNNPVRKARLSTMNDSCTRRKGVIGPKGGEYGGASPWCVVSESHSGFYGPIPWVMSARRSPQSALSTTLFEKASRTDTMGYTASIRIHGRPRWMDDARPLEPNGTSKLDLPRAPDARAALRHAHPFRHRACRGFVFRGASAGPELTVACCGASSDGRCRCASGGPARPSPARLGSACLGLVQFGPARLGSAQVRFIKSPARPNSLTLSRALASRSFFGSTTIFLC